VKRFWNSGCLIAGIGVWLAFSTGAVVIIALAVSRPNFRAEILMGAGLVLLWAGLGGFLMRRLRDPVRDFVRAIRSIGG
jgi:ABC-type transporter Mla maintaining outer membrane lipid asymmetry permease subunit MlaE